MTDRLAAVVEQLSQQNPFSGKDNLPDPPRPSEAAIPRDRPSLEQIPLIQEQINVLTYNHLPRTFFSLEKHRSLQSILLTAKEALTEALPIRCLEATFVALHFTQCLRDIDRIPLSFKSEANGNTYRHIVLVLRTRSSPSLYGALGLSRKSTLMYKPMTYRSLYDLVMDYKRCYESLGHELADIKLGIAITHDEHSRFDPCWRFIALKLSRYCEGAAGSPADRLDATPPAAVAPRLSASPPSPPGMRKTNGPSAEASLSSSAAPSAAAALSFAAPSSRGEGHLERSGDGSWGEASGGSAPPALPRRSSLSASTSVLSPLSPHSGSGAAAKRPENAAPTGATAVSVPGSGDPYAPLARLLSNYTRLLPTICEQYYKTIGTVDSNNRPLKLCYLDLDTAERDTAIENARRLQYIAELQSPLSPEARRLASTRQLRPAKKDQTGSRQANGDVSGTKRRQGGGNEGRPAKRRSPASAALGSSDGKKSSLAAGFGGPGASPRPARALSSSPKTPAAPAPAGLSLAAALAEHGRGSRFPGSLEGTMVDARSVGSGTSADQTNTEGYATPQDCRFATADASPVAPPLTPRNYDAHGPLPAYDVYLRTPSSSSDLFSSPASLRSTTVERFPLSP